MTIPIEHDLNWLPLLLDSPGPTTSFISSQLQDRRSQDSKKWLSFLSMLRETDVHRRLLEDPYTCRAFFKPRGYAGDAIMMDHIYDHPSVRQIKESSSALGRGILSHTAGDSLPAQAVRWRRDFIAQQITSLVEERGEARILSFACGHLREFELLEENVRRRVKIVAADSDTCSLTEVISSYSPLGKILATNFSVKDLLGQRRAELGTFDLVYTLGLLDYMSNRAAQRITERLWSAVNPSGVLVVANFTPETADAGYMEAFMDWWLTYKTVDDVRRFSERLPMNKSLKVLTDPWDQIAYLSCSKSI